jgi:hypothetical protein
MQVSNDQAPVCRQSSGDGNVGEISDLWLQEDNLLIVMLGLPWAGLINHYYLAFLSSRRGLRDNAF